MGRRWWLFRSWPLTIMAAEDQARVSDLMKAHHYYIGASAEVRCTRSLDRLGIQRAAWPSAPGDQQLALSDSPRRPAQAWFPHALPVRAPSGSPASVMTCSWRRPLLPRADPGHGLPRRQLDRSRAHPRLRPRWGRLQRARTAQARVPSPPVPHRAGPAARRRSRSPSAAWSAEGDAHRRTDAISPRVLPEHRRSSPPSGLAPCSADGTGAGRRRDVVRHARLQGDEQMDRRSRPQGIAALPRAAPRRPDRPPSLSAMSSLLIRVDPA